MLFEYKDDNGSSLVWCQGKVLDFIRGLKDKYVLVKIEWSDKCVRDGDTKITKKQLKKTKWDPNLPVGGAWQVAIYHKLMNKGQIFKGDIYKTATRNACEYVCDFVAGFWVLILYKEDCNCQNRQNLLVKNTENMCFIPGTIWMGCEYFFNYQMTFALHAHIY